MAREHAERHATLHRSTVMDMRRMEAALAQYDEKCLRKRHGNTVFAGKWLIQQAFGDGARVAIDTVNVVKGDTLSLHDSNCKVVDRVLSLFSTIDHGFDARRAYIAVYNATYIEVLAQFDL